jgi:hypothetical protein
MVNNKIVLSETKHTYNCSPMFPVPCVKYNLDKISPLYIRYIIYLFIYLFIYISKLLECCARLDGRMLTIESINTSSVPIRVGARFSSRELYSLATLLLPIRYL